MGTRVPASKLLTNRMMTSGIPKGRERSERLLWFQKNLQDQWIWTLLRTVMLRMVPVDWILLRTQNVKYFHTLEGTTVESLLTKLADELLVQDITEPSAVLGSLCDDELQAAYDHVLEQFALELLIGADKNSEWSCGKLVIAANEGPIHLLQAAFYAVKLEVQRRDNAQ
jgi:hypothetical protein